MVGKSQYMQALDDLIMLIIIQNPQLGLVGVVVCIVCNTYMYIVIIRKDPKYKSREKEEGKVLLLLNRLNVFPTFNTC